MHAFFKKKNRCFLFFSSRRRRHGPAAAHPSRLPLRRTLEVQAELHQEQLPGLAQVPQEEDAGYEATF